MTRFDKPIKIYLFKHKSTVSISFLVSPVLVNQYTLTTDEFENIINNFQKTVEFETEKGIYWYIESKEFGPRPEKKNGPYVRVSVSIMGMSSHYRFNLDDWNNMITEYTTQKNNKMYWD